MGVKKRHVQNTNQFCLNRFLKMRETELSKDWHQYLFPNIANLTESFAIWSQWNCWKIKLNKIVGNSSFVS